MNVVSLSFIQGSNPTQTTSQSVPYNGHILTVGNEQNIKQPLQNHNKPKTLPEYSVCLAHNPSITA